MDERDLARYQAALLDELAREGVTDDARVRSLRAREEMTPFASYVRAMEPCFIALGAELMRRWGRRDE